MFGIISRRFFHASHIHLNTARTSALGKLRKSTGYSMSNCKKAVELFPDDIAKAEEWLHAEAKQKGWSKWAKIQTRSATQGLIGVFSKNNVGVMVEVNCETDFVAKNTEFHLLMENILSGCMNHLSACSIREDVTKTLLDETQLNDIPHNSSTLGEMINSAVCKFNEKTVAKRGIFIKVKDNLNLSSVSHPSTSCPSLNGATLGKYGTLLAWKKSIDMADPIDDSLGENMCQHIIGMNPYSIGQLTDKDILNFTKKTELAEEPESNTMKSDESSESSTEEHDETEDQYTMDSNLKDSDETRLLFQPFLLDSTVTVGEVTYNSGVEIVDFERFECGEKHSENVEPQQASSVGI